MAHRPLAVALVHGVLVRDEAFHEAPARLLREHFHAAFAAGAPDPEEAIAIAPVHWAPVLQPRQDALFEKLADPRQREAVRGFTEVVEALNRGERGALLHLALPFLTRWSDAELHWTALRWLLVHFVGDALAYPASPSTRQVYEAAQAVFADALRALARSAGPEAPLVVVAHSLGTVLTSDFVYDLRRGRRAPGASALERGETLLAFHSLGSPLALWLLRADERGLGSPIEVPAPGAAGHLAGLPGGWFNYYDPDDVLAAPLRGLSPAYAKAVREDRRIRVGGRLLGPTPLAHPFYWTDPALGRIVGHRLAEAYAAANPDAGCTLAPAPD